MRFDRITVPAFGRFTDLSLDLSAGRAGLHVVYGPNEAGKSTLLRAIRQFLFGIPARSTDNFLHEHQQMRVGAELVGVDGQRVSLLRRKGNKNTLLDGVTGKVVADGVLAPFLAGITEGAYRSGFALGIEEVMQGGQGLLDGQGDVAEALFGAATGGAVRLRRLRDDLDRQIAALFKPRASKPPVNDVLRRLKAATQATRNGALRGREWQASQDEKAGLTAEVAAMKAELRDLERARQRLERWSRAARLLPRLRALEDERATLGGVDGLRPDLGDEARGLRDDRSRDRIALDEAMVRRDSLERKLVSIDVGSDAALLDVADTLERLHAELSRHEKTVDDLRRVRTRLLSRDDDIRAELDALLPDWSLDDLRERGAERPESRVLQKLATRCGALHDAVVRAGEARREAVAELAALGVGDPPDADPAATPGGETDAVAVVAAEQLRAMREGVGLSGELGRLDAHSARDRAALQAARAELRPPVDTQVHSRLAGVPVPEVVAIDRHDSVARERVAERRDWMQRRRALVERVARLAGEQAALAELGPVPTRAMLDGLRAHRDGLWQGVVEVVESGRLPEVPALDAVGAASGEADAAADQMIAEVERVREGARLVGEQAVVTRLEVELGEEEARLDAEEAKADEDWRALWQTSGVVPGAPADMRRWRRLWEGAVVAEQRAAESQAAAEAARSQVVGLTHQACLQLDALGEDTPAVDLPVDREYRLRLDQLDGAVERLREAARVRLERAARARELRARIVALSESEAASVAAVEAWESAWHTHLHAVGRPAGAGPVDVAVVETVIEDLRRQHDLSRRLAEADHDRMRVAAMARDQDAWRAAVSSLIDALPPSLVVHAGLPEVQVAQLQGRLREARRHRDALKALQEQKDELDEQIALLDTALVRHDTRLGELCEEAEVGDLPALLRRLDEGARAAALDARIRERADELREQGGAEPDALAATLASEDPDGLPQRIDELKAHGRELEERLAERNRSLGALSERLTTVASDDAARTGATDAATLEAELGGLGRRLMRLQLARVLLNQELEAWRTRNQGPLLQRTGDLFAALTCQSFEGVVTDFGDHDEPIILGARPSGERVGVAGMSAGSRDQLYLALRLAAVERHVEGAGPLPFVVDDVLVHFDRDRARAALGVLADLSDRTQVLLFTHDIGVVELARTLGQPERVFVHPLA